MNSVWRRYSGGRVRRTLAPYRVSRRMRLIGPLIGFWYDAAYAHDTSMVNPRGSPLSSMVVRSQLRHPRLERGAGAGAGEEEQHRQNLVLQQGMGLAEGTAPLEIERHLHDAVDLPLGPLLVGDQIATA